LKLDIKYLIIKTLIRLYYEYSYEFASIYAQLWGQNNIKYNNLFKQ
jgi:hypothetical protein